MTSMFVSCPTLLHVERFISRHFGVCFLHFMRSNRVNFETHIIFKIIFNINPRAYMSSLSRVTESSLPCVASAAALVQLGEVHGVSCLPRPEHFLWPHLQQ